jgi:hypothetical protein
MRFVKPVMISTFLLLSCAANGFDDDSALYASAVKRLLSIEGFRDDIDDIRVNGIPLAVAISVNGIDHKLIKSYEGKGGKYRFPSYFLDVLCKSGRFEDALFFVEQKQVIIDVAEIDGKRANCILTAVEFGNLVALRRFLSSIKSASDRSSVIQQLRSILKMRIEILEDFVHE